MSKMKLYLHSDFENYSKNRAPHTKCFLTEAVPAKICNDSVAQLVEHYTFNVGVLGSNPSGITTNTKATRKGGFLFYANP